MQAGALRDQAVHGLVGPLHEAVGADGDDGVLHAVEQGFELALAGADGGETLFDAAGGFIDGAGDAADFVLRSFQDAGLKVAFGDAGGDIDDALKAASAPIGGDRGHQQGEEEGHAGSQFQPAANLRGNGFDIGERIGQANGASRRWEPRHRETECQWWRCGAHCYPILPERAAANSGRVA